MKLISLSDGSGSTQAIEPTVPSMRFARARFVVVNLILGLLALVAGYFEFYSYPSLLISYGETNLSLHVSFLTYSFSATRCYGVNCTHLTGVPAFDFFQFFIYAIIVYTILQFIRLR